MAGAVTCPLVNWELVGMRKCNKCPQHTNNLPSNFWCMAQIKAKKREVKGQELVKEINNLIELRDKHWRNGNIREKDKCTETIILKQKHVLDIAKGRERVLKL